MVRLKVRQELTTAKATTFQFHYGTIKRELDQKDTQILQDLSIPLWYD